MTVPPLDERFDSFIRCLPGSLNMDGKDGFELPPVSGRQKCDYYLNTPETLVSISFFEQKTLEAKNFSAAELAFTHTVNTTEFEKDGWMRPDLSAVDYKAVERLTKRVAGYLGDANSQVRDASRTMAMPNGSCNGFLVILNEAVEAFSLKVLCGLVGIALDKKYPTGVSQYPYVNGVIIIDETARLQGSKTCMTAYKPAKLNQRDDADKIGQEIATLWGELAPTNGALNVLQASKSFLLKSWRMEVLLTSMVRSAGRVVGPQGHAVNGTLTGTLSV